MKGVFWKCLLHYWEGGKNENAICNSISIIVLAAFLPIVMPVLQTPGIHQNSSSLSCSVCIQERNNLKLTHSFILHAIGFHCVDCCWQESGWKFNGEWTTVNEVQNQKFPIASPFSVCLRIKRLFFLLLIWRQSTLFWILDSNLFCKIA